MDVSFKGINCMRLDHNKEYACSPPQFVSSLQDRLQQLAFASDTETLQTVTASLGQQYYTTPACIPALLTVAKDCEQWQVRQLAAVELRKRVPKFWDEIEDA
ncbi:hypothetical protein IW136_003329, partial [Coemansia sp. RSA 678]